MPALSAPDVRHSSPKARVNRLIAPILSGELRDQALGFDLGGIYDAKSTTDHGTL
jgi:hypothetical protein